MTDQDWIARFAGLSRLAPDLQRALRDGAALVEAPAGARLFEPGAAAQDLFLLLEGTVRVQQVSRSGREVHLYRVHAGESCVLCTACMLARQDHVAEGVAETPVRAAVIPRALFDDLTARSDDFRAFVFAAFSHRIADLFALIDELVFRRLDARLAARLVAMEEEGEVRATHQMLAGETGAAREGVSRLLADFHRRGWIEQGRGRLRLTDREALERLARQD